jgi:hypothetical protein
MKSMKLKEITFKTTNEQMGINNGSSLNPAVIGEKQIDGPQYPYGLRLCLDNDVIKALGFKDLPEVGQVMDLKAKVEVCSTNESESKEYGLKMYMDLQIVEMEIGKPKADPASKLYAEESDGYEEDGQGD